MTSEPPIAVAVDIGGTFTDITAYDPRSQTMVVHKVSSTPEDASLAMLGGLRDVVELDEVGRLVHGTTVGLNAFLSRSGSPTLVITTHPFRDLLHLGRAERTDIWRLDYQRPEPLVPLTDVYTVRERVAADGTVAEPLAEDDLAAVAERIERDAIRAVAVCLLHACRNPAHELHVRRLLRETFPDLIVSLSHEVASEVREYERFSTTVLNSYIAEPIARYLDHVQEETMQRGYRRPLFVMRSSGGVTSAEIAERSPIQTLLSGPAGGVVGAERLARALDRPNLVTADMGGTSLDVSLIVDGEMAWVSQTALEGLPILMPVVDLVTIGAGGGSIAWVEAGGLRVGPHSAGAVPGPVCYGRGGTQPTVTDANVVLGFIDPGYFLGGEIPLDADAARAAIGELAGQLGVDVMEAAAGVVAVTNARMADALRSVTIQRGHDPRDFSLLVYGGAGPLHGAALAEELEIAEVVVPLGTGVFSAWGMLHASVRHDVSAPVHLDSAGLTHDSLVRRFAALQERALSLLQRDGVATADARFSASADMRYVGQEFFVNVQGELSHTAADWTESFHRTYQRIHGHALPSNPAEIVNLRLTARGREFALSDARAGTSPPGRRPDRRPVFVGGDLVTARVVQRHDFAGPLPGPAIIEEAGSTTFVPPLWEARSGREHAIVLSRVG